MKKSKEPVVSRTEKVQKMIKSTEDPLTYTEIGRTVDEEGWPVVRCLRSDGKKVKMPIKRFKELKAAGRVLAGDKPKESAIGSKEPQPATVQIAAKFREAVSPAEFFGIHTSSGARVQILDKLDKEWEELLCYHYEYQKTMHLRRKDLLPVAAVQSAIEFLKVVTAH